MPLSVLQQELCFLSPTQSRFLSRESMLPHKNGIFLAELFSGEVEFSFCLGILYSEVHSTKFYSGNKRLKSYLYMD